MKMTRLVAQKTSRVFVCYYKDLKIAKKSRKNVLQFYMLYYLLYNIVLKINLHINVGLVFLIHI